MPIDQSWRDNVYIKAREYLATRGLDGATSTEIAYSIAGDGAEKVRATICGATAHGGIVAYGMACRKHRSDHPQGNHVYHLAERAEAVDAHRIECTRCREQKPRLEFGCVNRGCSELLKICNACTDTLNPEERRISREERVRKWHQTHRIATGEDARNSVDYQSPRRRVPICKVCYDLPHARPKTGLCKCGRPRYEEALPPLQERSFDRVAVP